MRWCGFYIGARDITFLVIDTFIILTHFRIFNFFLFFFLNYDFFFLLLLSRCDSLIWSLFVQWKSINRLWCKKIKKGLLLSLSAFIPFMHVIYRINNVVYIDINKGVWYIHECMEWFMNIGLHNNIFLED